MSMCSLNRSRSFPQHRSGVTLIELAVVVAILGLLFALLMTGIQRVREASRRMNCQSRLRQVGLAVAGYHSQNATMPAALSPTGSIHVSLLPYLDQRALYEKMIDAAQEGTNAIDQQVVKLPVYLCPSDSAGSPFPKAGVIGTNYAASIGVWAGYNGFDGAFRPREKPWSEWAYGAGPLRLTDFPDGTSHTSCFSEILRSDGSEHRLRVMWYGPPSGELNVFTKGCMGMAHGDTVSNATSRGTPWTDGTVGYTLYNHAMTPNNPSCYQQSYVIEAASTAGSNHASGVHVLYADGHITFTNENIDRRDWRATGSRNSSSRFL